MDRGVYGWAKSVVVLVMVLISVAVSSRGSIAPRIPSDEVAALKTISEKLNNTYWKNVSETSCSDNGKSFNTSIASGIFSNVACDCSFNNGTVCHVTNILLKGLNLSGVFPAEFGNLTQLTLIDLSRNYINGSIPASLSKIPLVNIALVGNRINGPIPDEFGNISTLQQANFEDNQFSGQLPASLGNLSNLQRLLLTSNFFNGTIPESFGNLKNLTDFRVDGSNFTGPIPDFIGNWTEMTTLNIQGAFSEGPIPATLSLLTNMSQLRISDLNQSSTPFPDLQNMTNLQILILRNCLITGTIPDYIGSMMKLKTLDLSFNQLTGPILDSIGSLPLLVDLFLSNNSLSGTVPGWLATNKPTYIDVSYNNFTGSPSASCQNTDVNLASSFSSIQSNSNHWCLMKDLACPADARYYSLYINCGGGQIRYDGNDYLDDTSTGSPSYFSSTGNQWALSSTGTFMYNDDAAFTASNTYNLSISGPEYFQTARVSASSLKYYGLCLRKGTYTVQLYFAEIMYSNDKTYASLGNRIFDIYIQGTLRQKNFNIMAEAGGVGKGINKTYRDIVVNGSTLEIFLYWAGKGTTAIPGRGVYGPLISAITVKPNFSVSNGFSVGAIVGIVIASFAVLASVLVLLKMKGYLGGKDDEDNNEFRGLDTGYFSLRQIQAATNDFNPINKIGEGGFGPVYKGVLPDGKVIAVKQLSAKSTQGNREFINEIGIISALQHSNLVKLHGCCIEGKELLLVYEYMVNNSLARALFGQRRTMFIQTQPTPNPSSLMFYPGKPVMEVGSADFPNARVAMNSPLAKSIFGIDGITRVFFGSDFVTVTKSDDASWDLLKPEIFAAIMDFCTSSQPLFLDAETATSKDTAIHEDDSETVAMIKELLETRIRPAVQDDGGDIEYRGFDVETGIVKLRMQGACSGCPSSSVTLKSGIENMLMHYVPEVKGVEQELDPEDEVAVLTGQME